MSVVRTIDSIASRVAKAESDLREIKQAQRIGADSLLIKNNQTANTWDVVNALLDHLKAESKWVVTFTPDEVPDKPFYCEFGLKWQMPVGATAYDEENLYYWDDPSTEGASNTTKKFIIAYMNGFFDDQRINMKFSVKSLVPGAITWSRTV